MHSTLVRNATLIVELAGKRLLVDPMLDEMGTQPPIDGTANPRPNPSVPLPFPAEEVVRDIDAVLVTDRHRDHLVGIDDVREVAAHVPTAVAVHLEAFNHCHLTRAELRAAVPGVLAPEDGESLELCPPPAPDRRDK